MVSFDTEIVSPTHYCGANNYGWNKNEKFMVVHNCVFHHYSRDNSSKQLTVKLQLCKRYSMDYYISKTSLLNWFSDNFQWRILSSIIVFQCGELSSLEKKQKALVLKPRPITGDGYITHAHRNRLLFSRRHRGPLDCILGVRTHTRPPVF